MTDRRAAVDDDDGIGPDGTVRLGCYLPHQSMHWFSVGCTGCGRLVPLGVRPAIELMGGGEFTVGQLERRLRCGACGSRAIRIQIAADPRPPDLRERRGPLPETRATLGQG